MLSANESGISKNLPGGMRMGGVTDVADILDPCLVSPFLMKLNVVTVCRSA